MEKKKESEASFYPRRCGMKKRGFKLFFLSKFVKKYRIRAINLPQKDEKMNGQLPNKSRICRDSQNGFKNLVKTEIV